LALLMAPVNVTLLEGCMELHALKPATRAAATSKDWGKVRREPIMLISGWNFYAMAGRQSVPASKKSV
jgi:hypothetical protein